MRRKEGPRSGAWLIVLAVASFALALYYILNAIDSIRMLYGN